MISKVEISHRTIIFSLLLVAGIWLMIQIRDILFLLFISFIIMSALRPLVDTMEKIKIPRVLAILILYGVIFGLFGVSLASAVPTLVVQSTKLVQELPDILQRILPYVDMNIQALSRQIAPIGENVVKVTVGIFSNVVTLVTVLAFTFYFLLERRNTEEFLRGLMGEAAGEKVFATIRRIEKRLSAWFLGQTVLMIFIGLIVYGGLMLLRLEFALPLAILAGGLEIVPMIGPVVSAIPAVLIALAHSPLLALSTIALYFIVQQVENSIVVPLVMKKSVGIPPIMTILALMIGGRLAGITGAVLAVPVLIVIQEAAASFLAPAEK